MLLLINYIYIYTSFVILNISVDVKIYIIAIYIYIWRLYSSEIYCQFIYNINIVCYSYRISFLSPTLFFAICKIKWPNYNIHWHLVLSKCSFWTLQLSDRKRARERETDLIGTWFFAVNSFLCPIRWGPAGILTYIHTPHESHINRSANWSSSEHNSWKKKHIWSLNECNMLDCTFTCLNLTFLNLTSELTALSCTWELLEKKNK